MSTDFSPGHLESTSAPPDPPDQHNATSSKDTGHTASHSSSAAELASLKISLSSSLRQVRTQGQWKGFVNALPLPHFNVPEWPASKKTGNRHGQRPSNRSCFRVLLQEVY